MMVEAKPQPGAEDPRLRMVDRELKRTGNRADALIEVLHVAQENFGYLNEEVLSYIARAL